MKDNDIKIELPVSVMDGNNICVLKDETLTIAYYGYDGINIHFRDSEILLDVDNFEAVLKMLNEIQAKRNTTRLEKIKLRETYSKFKINGKI